MTDLGKAREEYEKFTRYIAREPGYDPGMVADKADTLIAALEAEVEALKCCGNCGHLGSIYGSGTCNVETTHMDTPDPREQCLYVQRDGRSRWKERA